MIKEEFKNMTVYLVERPIVFRQNLIPKSTPPEINYELSGNALEECLKARLSAERAYSPAIILM